MTTEIKELIEELIKQELDEFNAVGAGGVSATGGQPLGINMTPQHNTMWSGNTPRKRKKKKLSELAELLDLMIEDNVLDRMGHTKATKSVRRGMIGGGAVYMDRDDPNKKRTKAVMSKVAKNLNKKPYSHDPPRMGLGEGLVRLLEGKIDIEIQKFNDNPFLRTYFATLKEKGVLPKFIPWLSKQTQALFGGAPEEKWLDYGLERWEELAVDDLGLVSRFEKLLGLNQIPQDSKDINKIPTKYALFRVIDAAEKEYEKKQEKKTAKKSAEKVYEDETILIIEPRSKEASCTYGKGTQWCISATSSENYYDSYARQGARFLFIINKQTGDKDAIAFAGDISAVEIYDAEDNSQKKTYIEKKYRDNKGVLEVLNSFLSPIIGKQPFATITPEDIFADPHKLLNNYDLFRDLMRDEHLDTSVKILETMAYFKWNSREDPYGWAYTRVREGISTLLDRIQQNLYVDQDGYAARLLRINKTNPKQFVVTTTAQELLAAYILTGSEGVDLYPHALIPLVLYPQELRDVLSYYLSNPEIQRGHLGRIIGKIEIARGRMNDVMYWKTRRYWENLIQGIEASDPDALYFKNKTLQKIKDFGDSVGWDFLGAALARV